MKMTPELTKAQEKMQPGALSRDGFLGRDHRNLSQIIIEQQAVCNRYCVSWEKLGQLMHKIGREGLATFGAPKVVDEKWEVVADENRGKMACPFPHPGMHQKTIYTVKNLRTNEQVRYTELSCHLIEAHGFFQGLGAEFHNDPEKLFRVFEVGDGCEEMPEVPLQL